MSTWNKHWNYENISAKTYVWSFNYSLAWISDECNPQLKPYHFSFLKNSITSKYSLRNAQHITVFKGQPLGSRSHFIDRCKSWECWEFMVSRSPGQRPLSSWVLLALALLRQALYSDSLGQECESRWTFSPNLHQSSSGSSWGWALPQSTPYVFSHEVSSCVLHSLTSFSRQCVHNKSPAHESSSLDSLLGNLSQEVETVYLVWWAGKSFLRRCHSSWDLYGQKKPVMRRSGGRGFQMAWGENERWVLEGQKGGQGNFRVAKGENGEEAAHQ